MRRVVLVAVALALLAVIPAGAGLARDGQVRQWATDTDASSEFGFGEDDCTGSWCFSDATGPPDTFECGDIETAWAPLTSGSDPEWLEVVFPIAVYATGVEIHETFNSGFVTSIELISSRGSLVVWEGSDTTACPGVLEVAFPQTKHLVDRVRIHTQIDGWEEIDTVKLIGVTPQSSDLEQWPSEATGSSSYGSAWSAMMAEGRPDTFECGDIETAWSPLTSGSDPEWLEVVFPTAVYATGVEIHETFNSGFVYQVDLLDTRGQYHTVWSGVDETSCPGRFAVTFDTTRYLVIGARIHTQIDGYEEIDAVALTGELPHR